MRPSLVLSLLSVTALPACVEGVDDTATDTAEITGGTLVASDVAPYDAVFRIEANGHGCTATKIGPRRLLTAAHCVRALELAPGVKMRASHELDVTGGIADRYEVANAWEHPTYANPNQGFDRSRDVGVVELTTDIAPEVDALPIRTAHVAGGTTGTVVGYGCDDVNPDHYHHKQRATTRAMPLAEVFDVTSWTDTYATRIYTANVIHDNATPGEACDGDSGGPVLYTDGGITRIGAVTRGHGSTVSWRPRLSGLSRWIANPGQDDIRHGSRGVLLNSVSDLCVGVPGASTAEDVQLAQAVCDGRAGLLDNQYWMLDVIAGDYFQIRNGKSGMCIGVAGGSTASGARIAQYDCDVLTTTNKNQAWRFAAWGSGFQLVNGKSGKCLMVAGSSSAVDADIVLEDCTTSEQRWNFIP